MMTKKTLLLAAMLTGISFNASAMSFSTVININQTLSVTPSGPSEVMQYQGTIDLPALTGVADLFSGTYNIWYGHVEFYFNQSDFLSGTSEDLVFDGTSTWVQSAQSEMLSYNGNQYNYVVDFINEDYYYDQRESAGVDIDLPYYQSAWFTDYEYNDLGESYNVPPGTTGTIERYTNSEYIETVSEYGYIWYDIYDFYPFNGVVNYNATATNGFLDLERIEIYIDYDHYTAIPVPAAAWLFATGLLGLVGVARRN